MKINELKVSINKGYCNKFQIGKCTFGDKCRYRHEIDPDYKKKDEVIVGKNNEENNKDRNKNKDKNDGRKPSKEGHKLYTLNNFNNLSSRMCVLKNDSKIVKNKKLACDMDDDKYEWKYNSAYDYLKNEEIKPYDENTMITSNAMICNFLAACIEGDIEYSHQNFIIRSTLGH